MEGKIEFLNLVNAVLIPNDLSYRDCKINIKNTIGTIFIKRDEQTFANKCYTMCGYGANFKWGSGYKKELPYFIQDWQGIYMKDSKDRISFEIRDHCFSNSKDIMGEFVCEIGYSQNGSKFDDWEVDFYTQKPNDKDYGGFVRIIEIKSEKEAVIKVFSMDYSNDFCNINVKKEDNTITLESGECKIDDFVLHNDIFGKYERVKQYQE